MCQVPTTLVGQEDACAEPNDKATPIAAARLVLFFTGHLPHHFQFQDDAYVFGRRNRAIVACDPLIMNESC